MIPIVTYLDMARVASGLAYPLIEESVQHAPEMTIIPAVPINGDTMSLTVRTGLPQVHFRRYNSGVPDSKSEFETRVFQAHPLDHQITVDKTLADNQVDRGRFFESHAKGVMEAKFRHVSRQTYYGIVNDPLGFPGLIAQSKSGATHVVDATGSTAKTSVWLLGIGPEKIEYLLPNGRPLTLQPDWDVDTVTDNDGHKFQAYQNWLNGAIGLRLANKNCAVRIKNIGTDEGKGLTDSLLYDALRLADDLGFEPTHIFMNGRSREQWRKSRITGLLPNPPIPTQFEGVTVVRTAGLINGETL